MTMTTHKHSQPAQHSHTRDCVSDGCSFFLRQVGRLLQPEPRRVRDIHRRGRLGCRIGQAGQTERLVYTHTHVGGCVRICRCVWRVWFVCAGSGQTDAGHPAAAWQDPQHRQSRHGEQDIPKQRTPGPQWVVKTSMLPHVHSVCVCVGNVQALIAALGLGVMVNGQQSPRQASGDGEGDDDVQFDKSSLR